MLYTGNVSVLLKSVVVELADPWLSVWVWRWEHTVDQAVCRAGFAAPHDRDPLWRDGQVFQIVEPDNAQSLLQYEKEHISTGIP